MAPNDLHAYLRRLGVPDPGPPSVEGLRRLHRAHVERVPYETIRIHLGRPTTVEPAESVRRIVSGAGGGYCFHLNGAFAALLAALGYEVRRHVGGVQTRQAPEPVAPNAGHLALTVHGLPGPRDAWFVDVGLGDALHEPIPLRPGAYAQGPFRYALGRSLTAPGGWRFDHDPGGSFTGMDFAPDPAGPADFAQRHAWLSTAPESGFTQVMVAQRRDAGGVDSLRGCLLSRWDGAGRAERDLETQSDWYSSLADLFGLTFPDVDSPERAALWRRVRSSHEAWRATPAGARP